MAVLKVILEQLAVQVIIAPALHLSCVLQAALLSNMSPCFHFVWWFKVSSDPLEVLLPELLLAWQSPGSSP